MQAVGQTLHIDFCEQHLRLLHLDFLEDLYEILDEPCA